MRSWTRPRPRVPGSPATRIALGALAFFVASLAGCAPKVELPAYDEAAAWETLWQPGAEAVDPEAAPPDGEAPAPEPPPTRVGFTTAVEALENVTVDDPPVVGKDYDPTFPPLLPFDPSEWLTNEGSPPVAMPSAKRGGMLRLSTPQNFPTVRSEGPNSRMALLTDVENLVYEALMGYDYALGDYVPSLASHWQIGEDKMTFRFRMDERARWQDGREVTADDVAATFEHLKNPDRKDPLVRAYFEDLVETVKVLDKYTVEVKSKKPFWRSLLVISGTAIRPAAYIRMDGDTYINDWNWKLPPGTGAYKLLPEDVKKGRSITLTRDKNWWGDQIPSNAGTFNFDKIQWKIIRDASSEFQQFMAGDLDLYVVPRAQQWVDELKDEEAIRKGWVQMRRIYNRKPNGPGGYAMNMRVPPFDDLNVRKAFACLFPRELLFDKYLFHQYEYIDSYYPGSPFARDNAERVKYDPEQARRLLAESGWKSRDAEGYLVNAEGKRFEELTLEYASPSFTRLHRPFCEALWNEAGIKMELKVIDYSALLKNVWDHKFKLTFWNWTASYFPEPIQNFHSRDANKVNSNNLCGFADPEADKLMEDYMSEFSEPKRVQMLKRLDEILFESHQYALAWYGPYLRILYWDKFGHPPEYGSVVARDMNNITPLWWYDEERDLRTKENMAINRSNYPDRPMGQYDEIDHKWWLKSMVPMPRQKD